MLSMQFVSFFFYLLVGSLFLLLGRNKLKTVVKTQVFINFFFFPLDETALKRNDNMMVLIEVEQGLPCIQGNLNDDVEI